MDIEYMDQFPRRNLQITAHAAALLPARSGEVKNPDMLHRKTAEHYVSVSRAAQLAGFANVVFITYCIRQVLGLVLFFAAFAEAYYFLKGNHIGIQLPQYLRNP